MSILRVQRCALCLFATFGGVMASGCLISPPVELEREDRIAPSVFMEQVLPSLLRPVKTNSVDLSLNPEFRAPFISEDLGEQVWGRLYLNYNGKQNIIIGYGQRSASHIGDEEREMVISWTDSLDRPAGCHSVTMAITHKDNFGNDLRPIDTEKTAFVVWWVSHDSEFQNVTLYDCNETSAQPP